jgi:hypothetical protein
MIRKIERHWFEVWGTETAQNRFLKGLLALLIALLVLQTITIVILGLRKPSLIAVTPTQTGILKVEPPPQELLESEVNRVTREYIAKHYNWDWQRIEQTQKEAIKYVAPEFERAFSKANAEQVKVAKEKKLSQKYYVSDLTTDLQGKVVRVTGDRILLVEGLRATNPMILEVFYDNGPRTGTNPSGIYVTADKLITNPDGK